MIARENIAAVTLDWIGTPYHHQASLKGVGCDCLGLIRGVWRELQGPEPEELPPYTRDWGDVTGSEPLLAAARRYRVQFPRGEVVPLGPFHHGAGDLRRPCPCRARRQGGRRAGAGGRQDHKGEMTLRWAFMSHSARLN